MRPVIRDDGALALVQARASSSRLPGKVLADVAGEPMLALQLRRLAPARELGRLVVATSDRPDDDLVAEVAAGCGAEVFRGSLEDVLGRFAAAVRDFDGVVVRITGDCPLIDPAVVDEVVAALRAAGADYASNAHPRTHPHGLDCEALPASVLRRLDAEVADPRLREHVTLALRERLDDHRWVNVAVDDPIPQARWTVDHPEDLAFVRALVPRLGERRHVAGWREILDAVRAAPSLARFEGVRG